MRLDVYLTRQKWVSFGVSFDKGITYKEVAEEVYKDNITHNLSVMAQKAGIYEAL